MALLAKKSRFSCGETKTSVQTRPALSLSWFGTRYMQQGRERGVQEGREREGGGRDVPSTPGGDEPLWQRKLGGRISRVSGQKRNINNKKWRSQGSPSWEVGGQQTYQEQGFRPAEDTASERKEEEEEERGSGRRRERRWEDDCGQLFVTMCSLGFDTMRVSLQTKIPHSRSATPIMIQMLISLYSIYSSAPPRSVHVSRAPQGRTGRAEGRQSKYSQTVAADHAPCAAISDHLGTLRVTYSSYIANTSLHRRSTSARPPSHSPCIALSTTQLPSSPRPCPASHPAHDTAAPTTSFFRHSS